MIPKRKADEELLLQTASWASLDDALVMIVNQAWRTARREGLSPKWVDVLIKGIAGLRSNSSTKHSQSELQVAKDILEEIRLAEESVDRKIAAARKHGIKVDDDLQSH
jgi:hypothetical protein